MQWSLKHIYWRITLGSNINWFRPSDAYMHWYFFSPRRHQAIIWTNAEMLLIEPLETNFGKILIKILTI